jgi:tRNA threonylcarbamoyladenosine biosynthesis protein TsaE
MIIYDINVNEEQQTFKVADQLVQNNLLSNNHEDINSEATVIYLEGDLGVGKTTFMRGMLASFGFTGAVKSPTYTIVEPYTNLSWPVYHFDLYRLDKPSDLELICIRDYLQPQAICCFEWPDKGLGHIPLPHFTIRIEIQSDNTRQITITKH